MVPRSRDLPGALLRRPGRSHPASPLLPGAGRRRLCPTRNGTKPERSASPRSPMAPIPAAAWPRPTRSSRSTDTPERPTPRPDRHPRARRRLCPRARARRSGRRRGRACRRPDRRRRHRSTTSSPAPQWRSRSAAGPTAPSPGRSTHCRSAPASTSSSSVARTDGRLVLDPDPDRGRRHAAPHPGPWSARASTARPAPPAPRPRRSRPISAPSPARSASAASAPTTGSTSSSSIAAPRPARPRPVHCSIAGLDRSGGKDLQLLQWSQSGRPQWFEASGVGRQSGTAAAPVPGNVSSNYGMRRHPILGYSRMHRGMDFRAGYGTPILAATDGRVARPGWAGGYGKQVRIAHAGGIMTTYSHMSRIVARPGSQRPPGPGDRLCRLDRPVDRAAPALRDVSRTAWPSTRARSASSPAPSLSGQDLAQFRAKLRNLLSVPVGAARRAGWRGARRTRRSRPPDGDQRLRYGPGSEIHVAAAGHVRGDAICIVVRGVAAAIGESRHVVVIECRPTHCPDKVPAPDEWARRTIHPLPRARC